MKKVLAIAIILTMALSNLTAFADTTSTDTAVGATVTTATTAVTSGTAATTTATDAAKTANKAFQQGVKTLKTQLATIRTNDKKLNKLSGEAKKELKRVQNLIKKAMVKNLTDEKIKKIDAILMTINQDQTLLNVTAGKISAQTKLLNTARKNKDLEAYKAAVTAIISIQNDRINALTKLVNDMKVVTAI